MDFECSKWYTIENRLNWFTDIEIDRNFLSIAALINGTQYVGLRVGVWCRCQITPRVENTEPCTPTHTDDVTLLKGEDEHRWLTSVRELFSKLNGSNVNEPERTREHTICCCCCFIDREHRL